MLLSSARSGRLCNRTYGPDPPAKSTMNVARADGLLGQLGVGNPPRWFVGNLRPLGLGRGRDWRSPQQDRSREATVDEEQPIARLNRRDAIRKGAIVIGAAWTLPVIQSVTIPAFAGSGPPSTNFCCTCTCFDRTSGPFTHCLPNQPDAPTCLTNCLAYCTSVGAIPTGELSSPCPDSSPATCVPAQVGTQCVCGD